MSSLKLLEQQIVTTAQAWAETPNDATLLAKQRELFLELREALETGQARAALPVPIEGQAEGPRQWQAQTWVKQGILMGFRSGVLTPIGAPASDARYFDKDTMPPRHFELEDGVRVVPGGTSVRRGAFLAKGVTLMPPAYVNIGAYIGADTLIDSHALVGSCAQVGQRVHVSAAAQIGGVLEPIGALPVIIEDDVMVGGNCGVYEGVIVREGVVLATGTILNASTAVYDLIHQKILRAGPDGPLEIPARAVVIPGMRRLPGDFADAYGLGISTPIILKYRDARTDGRTALEAALRMNG